MDKYYCYDTILTTLAVILIIGSIGFMNGSQDKKIAAQAILIERLQGDVKAMTSAFKEISLELLKSQYAYSSWSVEIDKFRKAMDDVPEIPPIGRWENKKEATRGEME